MAVPRAAAFADEMVGDLQHRHALGQTKASGIDAVLGNNSETSTPGDNLGSVCVPASRWANHALQ
jgi:hypothetical protein